jgi:hypothetical protein
MDVKLTDWPTVGDVGEREKSTVKGGTVTVTVIVAEVPKLPL